MTREWFEMIIKRAYFDGIEAGVNEVPAAPGWKPQQGASPEEMWQASEAKKLVDRWYP